jgi:uncharacterized protein (TIGR02145 family)
MKKIITICAALILAASVFAQAPQKMSYQAVIRDNGNALVINQAVGMQISILQGSVTGTAAYVETHTTNTNTNGLISIEIGGGTAVSGTFAGINWANGPFFVKTETDPTGGGNYSISGTSQLLSVPYALHSLTADSIIGGIPVFSGDYNDLINKPVLASVANTGNYDDLINKPLIPSVPSNISSFTNDAGYLTNDNDNQLLSVSTTGDTLRLQNGGYVIIPGISAANNNNNSNSIVDADGNTYTSIVIGNQEWMVENLKTTKYSNGDIIPNVTDVNQWANLNTHAWSYYNNDSQYNNPYGKLYNWYAVIDPRNICPVGWHVPSYDESVILVNFLGGPNAAGGKMKITGTQFWQSPNTGATNESGFSAYPGGSRSQNGNFYYMGIDSRWWSKTEELSISGWGYVLNYDNANNDIGGYYKQAGLYVRCIKN